MFNKNNSVVYFNKEEMDKQVEAIDIKKWKPLSTLKVAVKDNIAVQGQPFACGSNILKDFISPYDATVVKKLRDNGLLIACRTNMDEFGMGSSTSTSIYGKCFNPLYAEGTHSAGGSSGGSAAVVAEGLVNVSLGSDTGGSVRQPAAYCNVVGLKPTYGVISRHGLGAYASSLDTIGVIGVNPRITYDVFNIIRGQDSNDSTSIDTTGMYEDANGSIAKLPKSIGLIKEHFDNPNLDPILKKNIEEAIEHFKNNEVIIKWFDSKYLKYAISTYYIIAMAEASSNLGRYDGVRYSKRADDAYGIDALYKKSRGQGFGTEVKRRILMGTYILSAGYSDKYYTKAQQVRALIKEEMDSFLEKCDVILSPVTPKIAKSFANVHVNPLEEYLADLYTVPVNLCGLPAISLPINRDEIKGSFQLIGKNFSELDLCYYGIGYNICTVAARNGINNWKEYTK